MDDNVKPDALFESGIDKGRTGILPFQTINQMLREKQIIAPVDILPEQVQPASLDLRLGLTAWRVRSSFLPSFSAVEDKIREFDGYEIDISKGAVLERNTVYVVKLLESLDLKSALAGRELTGFANPKSSTGRLDILTRLITDNGKHFDEIEPKYKGPLYLEIVPRTFSIVVQTGDRLNQIRFRTGSPPTSEGEIFSLLEKRVISSSDEKPTVKDKLFGVTVDLKGKGAGSLIGYRARRHTDRIDIRGGRYPAGDFWEPIHAQNDARLVLDPNDFYILATREDIRVPEDYAAEMLAYDVSVGAFRVHYAGFFDPGFGWDTPSKAVLEVRSHDVPFTLEHGQIVGWLRYERMAAVPEKLYGGALGSNYQGQGLALAKQFRQAS